MAYNEWDVLVPQIREQILGSYPTHPPTLIVI